MYLLFALGSAFCTALGTFLTRSLIQKLPAFQIVGPLFLFNSIFALPFVFIRQDWVPLTATQWWEIALLGVLTAIGAIFVFVIVKRASASLSIVGAALSPAMVLLLSPFFLKVSVRPLQFIVVAVLVIATLFPIRKSVLGIHSTLTFLFMLAQGINAGVIAILISRLARAGVGLSQFLFIQQVIAGLIFTFIFWPKDVALRSYPLLAKRAVFMSMGWFLSFVAIHRGSTLVVQSVLSVIPLIIVLMETIAYKKRPGQAVVVSSLLVIACIAALSLA
jgi:drug/metabolite transporter (DMT)-like permease